MAIPDLEFPDLASVMVDDLWEAIKACLKNDVNLKGRVTLRLWEGEVDDSAPPTVNQMPWIRVTPIASPMRVGDEASWLADLTFKYELAVAGLKYRNLFRLFSAFQKALNFNRMVGDQAVFQVLRDSGAVAHEFRQAAIGATRARDVDPDGQNTQLPPQNLGSVGVFVVRAYLPAIDPSTS